MPSADAVENVLPDYKYIFYDPNRKTKPKETPKQAEEPVAAASPSAVREGPSPTQLAAKSKSLEQTQMNLLDHQVSNP